MARRTPKVEETAVSEDTAVLPVVEVEIETVSGPAVPPEETPVAPSPKLAAPAKRTPPAPPAVPHDTVVTVRLEVESLVVNHQRRLQGEKFTTTYGEYTRLAAAQPGALSVKLPGSENYTK